MILMNHSKTKWRCLERSELGYKKKKLIRRKYILRFFLSGKNYRRNFKDIYFWHKPIVFFFRNLHKAPSLNECSTYKFSDVRCKVANARPHNYYAFCMHYIIMPLIIIIMHILLIQVCNERIWQIFLKRKKKLLTLLLHYRAQLWHNFVCITSNTN